MNAAKGTKLRRGGALIAFAAVIAGVAGCGASSTAHQAESRAPSTSVAASVAPQGQSACADLDGTVDPNAICHAHSATSTYTIDISFPLDYPQMSPVSAFLKQNRDAFIDWVADIGPRGGRNRPYMYAVTAKTYRSGSPDSGTQSLVLKIDNDTGLAHEGHPNTIFRAFTFDLAKRAPITFDTLFKPGAKPLDVLNPIVQRQLHAQSADLDEESYQNFAITDDAVIFFFGQDQVVHDNAGPHKVTVPRSQLASLLA
jgi:hypothetical protein